MFGVSTALAATLGLTFAPFGAIDGRLARGPWHGFDDESSPLLLVARFERGKIPSGSECAALAREVAAYRPGAAFDPGRPDFAAWAPWSEEDDEAASDCDDFPCKVKLSESEVAAMKTVPENARKARWQALVAARAVAYAKTGKRSEYEFPGDPADPWARLPGWGFDVPAGISGGAASLVARRLAFAPGKLRPIRQVLDVRSSAGKDSARVLIRDAYTAHYFDGWGEWISFDCDAKSGVATLGHALVLEFDLLKKGDILSRISRGKMKSVVDERGRAYLDEARAAVLKEKLEPVAEPESAGK